jgi:HlyD family secretion protein
VKLNLQTLRQTILQWAKQRPVATGSIGFAVVALLALLFVRPGAPAGASSYFEVKRGDFLISIVEGGTLEAVDEVSIRNEVEGTARIIFIVPEGSYVKAGDLLVELDSSASQDAVNLQQINVEKAQFAQIQAEQQLQIQGSVVDSDIAAALLKVEFAESDLDKYIKGEALQLRRNAQIEITNVLESLRIAEDRLQWSEELFKQGFETKSNLDKDRLSVSQSKLKLEQAEKALWMLETFDEKKRKRELEAALQAARDDLQRVRLQGERIVAQYRAEVDTQRSTLELSKSKLTRDMKQLQATKIHAPQDGLVVYASSGGGGRYSSESMIEEGAVVRNRQELIKLPDISEMKLQVKIHESHINQVRLGQPAFLVLDSMPDQRLRGVVNKVGLLPDGSSRWSNPNLKVYATEVLVTDQLPDVKPGVSARAEIIITNLANVLTVPIQAVTTRKGQQVVFLADTAEKPVAVGVGMYNTRFIEITSGLRDGDRVLLAPPLDAEAKDLGGGILATGEELPEGTTNRLVAPPLRKRDPNGRSPAERLNPGPGDSTDTRPTGERRRPGSENAGSEVFGDVPRNGEREGRRGGPGGEGAGSRPDRQEMIKQFDTNGDGQLDDTERAAMRERFSRERGRRPSPAEPAARE